MHKLLVGPALAATAFASTVGAQVGEKPPEFDPVKWYNTPPLTLGQLEGKAILVEVFRTW